MEETDKDPTYTLDQFVTIDGLGIIIAAAQERLQATPEYAMLVKLQAHHQRLLKEFKMPGDVYDFEGELTALTREMGPRKKMEHRPLSVEELAAHQSIKPEDDIRNPPESILNPAPIVGPEPAPVAQEAPNVPPQQPA